jgi:hypothetical protein
MIQAVVARKHEMIFRRAAWFSDLTSSRLVLARPCRRRIRPERQLSADKLRSVGRRTTVEDDLNRLPYCDEARAFGLCESNRLN